MTTPPEDDLLAQLSAGGAKLPSSAVPQLPRGTSYTPPIVSPKPPTTSAAVPRPRVYKSAPNSSARKIEKAHVPAVLKDPITGEIVRLTERRREIIDNLPQNTSFAATARAVGADASTVAETFRMPAVQEYFRQLLARNGVTDGYIAQRIKEGLDATTRKEFMSKEGDLVAGEERPDLEQRGRYIDRALRLQGLDKAPDPGGDDPHRRAQININIASLSVDELKSLARALTSRDKEPTEGMAPTSHITEAEIVPPPASDAQ